MVRLSSFVIVLAAMSVVACGPSPKPAPAAPKSPAAVAQPEAAQSDPGPQTGGLDVFVPAAMIGDDYWVYVDGHIVSAPPRREDGTAHRSDFIVIAAAGGGWELFNESGRILRMQHEEWKEPFYTPDDHMPAEFTGDPLHIFRTTELSFPSGDHVVEVMILSPTGAATAFPFVITQKYTARVQFGWPAHVVVAIPDDWHDGPPLPVPVMAYRHCFKEAPADSDELKATTVRYLSDPMVALLRGAKASLRLNSEHVVTLDLPPAQGGPREVDGRQIGAIVDALEEKFDFPMPQEIAQCQSRYPQFADSYAQYGKNIAVLTAEIASFRAFAASLEQTP